MAKARSGFPYNKGMNDNNKIEYFEVTHFGYHTDSSQPGEVTGSYGNYSTYELAKARFDEVVKHYEEEDEHPVEQDETFARFGYDDNGWQVEIVKRTLELDVPVHDFF